MNIEQAKQEFYRLEGKRGVREIRAALVKIKNTTVRNESEKVKKDYMIFKLNLAISAMPQGGLINLAFSNQVEELETYQDLERLLPNNQLGKLTDRGKTAPRGMIDRYWNKKDMKVLFNDQNTDIRKGQKIPSNFDPSSERYFQDYFAISGIEYGNWLNQLDRLNYLNGAALAFFDLQTILGFSSKQIGFHKILSMAFGARGSGKALAHFEPSTFVINLTRFKRESAARIKASKVKREERLMRSGGVGSLAHEYGHALDYFAGYYIDPMSNGKEALTGGGSTSTNVNNSLIAKKNLRGLMEKILKGIIWSSSGNELSTYYIRLKAKAKANDYWYRRNEIFARAFEIYILYKLKKRGWLNLYLQELKYENAYYLSLNEIAKLEKDFDTLIAAIRSKLTPNAANKARQIIH